MTLTLHTAPGQWLFTGAPATPDVPAPLPVAGGLLIVDATRPDAIPWADVHDLEAARPWLLELYGSEAVAAAATMPDADEPTTTSTATEFPDVHPPAGHLLIRLALARWLHRWWPSASIGIARLDQRLLRAEIGALTWRAEDYLEPEEDPAAWFATEEWAAAAEALDADPGSPARAQAYARALSDLVEAAADLDPDPDPDTDALERLLTARLPWPSPPVVIETRPIPEQTYALAAGESTTSGVDWWLVPPRSVASGEDALSWQERMGEVTIRLAVGDEPRPELLARAYATDEPLPAIGRLPLTGDAYVGQLPNPFAGPIERVEAYATGLARPPRDGLAASVWRDRVRRVAAARTSAAVDGVALGGVAPFAAEILATRS